MDQHRPVVVVTRPALPGAGLDRLAAHVEVVWYGGDAAPTLDQLAPLLGRADGLLSMTTDRVGAHLLDAAPRLRVVSNAGVRIGDGPAACHGYVASATAQSRALRQVARPNQCRWTEDEWADREGACPRAPEP